MEFIDDVKQQVGKSLKDLEPRQLHHRNEAFKKTARRYRRLSKVAVPSVPATFALAVWTEWHLEFVLTGLLTTALTIWVMANLFLALVSVDVYGTALKGRVKEIRRWCIDAGITGTDLDTALLAWAKRPDGSEACRIQSVIEAHRA